MESNFRGIRVVSNDMLTWLMILGKILRFFIMIPVKIIQGILWFNCWCLHSDKDVVNSIPTNNFRGLNSFVWRIYQYEWRCNRCGRKWYNYDKGGEMGIMPDNPNDFEPLTTKIKRDLGK